MDEGDNDGETAGIAVKNALPLCLTPNVSAVLALLWLNAKSFRSLLDRVVGGVPVAVYALLRGGGCREGE